MYTVIYIYVLFYIITLKYACIHKYIRILVYNIASHKNLFIQEME